MQSFLERLKQARPVLLDGAVGSELNRRGADTSLPLWSASALADAPDLLREIHADHVRAGSEVITANTFRAHAVNLAAAGWEHRAAELTRTAVTLAREAIAREAVAHQTWVAGSLAPLADCYSPHLVPDDATLMREHRRTAENLAAAGADLILAETHNTIREAVAATQAATSTGLPVLLSLVCGCDGRLLSGESIAQAVEAAAPFGPVALMINCAPAPDMRNMLLELQAAAGGIPCGGQGNIGRPDPTLGWVNTEAEQPQRYASLAADWLRDGATLVGGCCGTTPEHIARLKDVIDLHSQSDRRGNPREDVGE